jgi:signal transduction histidine kinase
VSVNEENNVAQPATDEVKKEPNETVTKLRTLSHDLSNYIETIMQASYLLAQAKLDDNNKKWLDLIDKASQDAARINREIRDILRAQG